MAMMKRFLPIDGESVMDAAEIVIEVPQGSIAALVMELDLLLDAMTASLFIRSNMGPSVRLTVLDCDWVGKATVARGSDGSVSFAIGRNQAEHLRATLLRAYRDGMAQVDHVHIEGQHDDAFFDLTFLFDVVQEPMTPEEAAELIDEERGCLN